MDNAADTLAFVHQIKGLVDPLQSHGVGDEVIEFELTGEVTLNIAYSKYPSAYCT